MPSAPVATGTPSPPEDDAGRLYDVADSTRAVGRFAISTQSVLTGARAKVERARRHVTELEWSIAQWQEQIPCRMLDTANAERTEHRFTLSIRIPLDAVQWALTAGDCVHNLRSALDQVVWEAARRHGEPPPDTGFPIFTNAETYLRPQDDATGGLHRIRGIEAPAVRDLVEAFQPFRLHPAEPGTEALAVLHDLDRRDRHRLLTPVLFVKRDFRSTGSFQYVDGAAAANAVPPTILVAAGPLDDGSEVATVTTGLPAKRVDISAALVFVVGIETFPGSIEGITSTLAQLAQYVTVVVDAFESTLVGP